LSVFTGGKSTLENTFSRPLFANQHN